VALCSRFDAPGHTSVTVSDTEPWTDAAWLADATSWIRERVTVTGELDQFHVRWWSTVLRVPTADGDLYFKAVGPGFGFEPALTARLADVYPDRLPELIDIDLDRGWMLMRDAGVRLRELVHSAADLDHWERALPRYAELQIAATPLAEELLELGVPDERLATLPRRFRELVANRPPGLTAAESERLEQAVPEVEALCRELGGYGISETIQHDDLHDGQVFVLDGRYVYFDWGDACLSHPFHTLTVTLRAAAARLDLEPGGGELQRLRDAYLEPFGDRHEVAELAYRTGTIARALAWQRFTTTAGRHADPEDASAPAYGLKLFLENGPIGSWREP
jgi:phosphotransferase family enzyme